MRQSARFSLAAAMIGGGRREDFAAGDRVKVAAEIFAAGAGGEVAGMRPRRPVPREEQPVPQSARRLRRATSASRPRSAVRRSQIRMSVAERAEMRRPAEAVPGAVAAVVAAAAGAAVAQTPAARPVPLPAIHPCGPLRCSALRRPAMPPAAARARARAMRRDRRAGRARRSAAPIRSASDPLHKVFATSGVSKCSGRPACSKRG